MQIILSYLLALLFFSAMRTCLHRNELADSFFCVCFIISFLLIRFFFLFIFEGLVSFRCLFECLLAEGVV